jgi:ribonuclease HI
MKKNEIIIYTDGSSLGNPGPGGWGAVVVIPFQGSGKSQVENKDLKVIELGGREAESTNNRMEMNAAIEALNLIQTKKVTANKIIIHTDSAYVLNGITMWVYGWVKNNWQTKTKDPVLNKDLWEILYKVENNLKHKIEIEWVKVKGHSGVLLNERCDEIATEFAASKRPLLFTGSLEDYEKLFGSIGKENKEPTIKKSKKSSNGRLAYSYVSFVGGKIYADKTWVECEKRVKGKSGAKYKKVFGKQEEQELIGLWSIKSLF